MATEAGMREEAEGNEEVVATRVGCEEEGMEAVVEVCLGVMMEEERPAEMPVVALQVARKAAVILVAGKVGETMEEVIAGERRVVEDDMEAVWEVEGKEGLATVEEQVAVRVVTAEAMERRKR